MIGQIIAHTPTWVWVLFTVLAVLGARQLRTRQSSLQQVILRPLPLVAISVWSVVSAAAAQPLALVIWAALLAGVARLLLNRQPPPGTSFDPASRIFTLPGSGVPLALMLGIFFVKYVAGATVALHPEVAAQAGFALPMAGLSGAFSGVLVGRVMRLARLAKTSTSRAPDPTQRPA